MIYANLFFDGQRWEKKERKLETAAIIQFHLLLLFFNGSLCCYVFQIAGRQLKPSLSNLTNKSSIFIFFHLVIFPKRHLGFALEAEKGARMKKNQALYVPAH